MNITPDVVSGAFSNGARDFLARGERSAEDLSAVFLHFAEAFPRKFGEEHRGYGMRLMGMINRADQNVTRKLELTDS